MKYFSMFSGIGGFEYGIERACTGIESTDDKSYNTEPEIQFGGQRTTVEEGLCVLPSDNRELGI